VNRESFERSRLAVIRGGGVARLPVPVGITHRTRVGYTIAKSSALDGTFLGRSLIEADLKHMTYV